MSDEEIYEKTFNLLKKMALMDRPNSPPDELALQRGTASDATYLFSSDFKEARLILKELGIIMLDN